MHSNDTFPHRTALFNFITNICDSLASFRAVFYTLREALTMALDIRTLLHHDLVADIVQLCELMVSAFCQKAPANWIIAAFGGAVSFKTARTDLSVIDHSVNRSRPRRREDPSSGRGVPKSVTLRSTFDSDSAQPPPWGRSRKERPKQVHHIYRAPECDDSHSPPSPLAPLPPPALPAAGPPHSRCQPPALPRPTKSYSNNYSSNRRYDGPPPGPPWAFSRAL